MRNSALFLEVVETVENARGLGDAREWHEPLTMACRQSAGGGDGLNFSTCLRRARRHGRGFANKLKS